MKSPKAPTSLQEASVSGSGGDKQAELVATAEPQEQPSSTVALQPAAVADISEKSGEKIVSQLDSTAASSVATPSAGESGEGERTCGHGVQLQADNTTTSTDHPTSAVSVDEKEENAGEQLSTGPADSGKTESNGAQLAFCLDGSENYSLI